MTESLERGWRILVVEDELLIAASLEIVLERHGHIVVGPAPTLAAARAELKLPQPDLALLDYCSAESTTEPLLPEPHERGIPACILTGYSPDQLPAAYASAKYWKSRSACGNQWRPLPECGCAA